MLALVVALAACHSNVTLVGLYYPKDYQWHKNTQFIKVHWNLKKTDKGTVVADGFVEPFSPRYGVHHVNLELLGLDKSGNVVNSAKGMPEEITVVSPIDRSPFKIEMKLRGDEQDFTVKGQYFHFVSGGVVDLGAASLDYIPLKSNED